MTKEYHKIDVLLKLVRAKLTGPWEGGGMGEKNKKVVIGM